MRITKKPGGARDLFEFQDRASELPVLAYLEAKHRAF
jgi:hypothetical protein